jgi:hypothetical protein
MLEAMARIYPSQPNDAMARIASRRNRTISLDPNLPGQIPGGSLDVDTKLFSKVQIDSKENCARISYKMRPPVTQSVTSTHSFTFSLAAVSAVVLGEFCLASSFD